METLRDFTVVQDFGQHPRDMGVHIRIVTGGPARHVFRVLFNHGSMISDHATEEESIVAAKAAHESVDMLKVMLAQRETLRRLLAKK